MDLLSGTLRILIDERLTKHLNVAASPRIAPIIMLIATL